MYSSALFLDVFAISATIASILFDATFILNSSNSCGFILMFSKSIISICDFLNLRLLVFLLSFLINIRKVSFYLLLNYGKYFITNVFCMYLKNRAFYKKLQEMQCIYANLQLQKCYF
jgi:hypothetical protein